MSTILFNYTFLPADNPRGKIILKIGRKIGNAVARNKIKRRIRHIIRELPTELDADIMLYAQKNIKTADFTALKQDILSMMQHILS